MWCVSVRWVLGLKLVPKLSVTTTFSRQTRGFRTNFIFPRDRNATWDHFGVTTEVVTVKIWVVGVIDYLEELVKLPLW